MVCPNCNYNNPDTNTYCDGCGTKLSFNVSKININSNQVDILSYVIKGLQSTIFGIIFCAIVLKFMIFGTSNVNYVVGFPFLICGLSVVLIGIVFLYRGTHSSSNASYDDLVKQDKTNKFFNKLDFIASNMYQIGFLLFWFGFLIFFDYQAILTWSEGGNQLVIFSLLFWAVGIFMVVKLFKGNKK